MQNQQRRWVYDLSTYICQWKYKCFVFPIPSWVVGGLYMKVDEGRGKYHFPLGLIFLLQYILQYYESALWGYNSTASHFLEPLKSETLFTIQRSELKGASLKEYQKWFTIDALGAIFAIYMKNVENVENVDNVDTPLSIDL